MTTYRQPTFAHLWHLAAYLAGLGAAIHWSYTELAPVVRQTLNLLHGGLNQ